MNEFTTEEKLLVHRCYVCGIIFAIPASYEKNRREDGKRFKCPNDHSLNFSKATEESFEDLKARYEALEQEAAETRTNNIRLSSQLDQKDAQIEVLEQRFLTSDIEDAPPPPPPPPPATDD
jgi:hypothetical protein